MSEIIHLHPILTTLVIVAAVWGLRDAIGTANAIARPVRANKRLNTTPRHAAD